MQPQFEDGASLRFRQAIVAVLAQSAWRGSAISAISGAMSRAGQSRPIRGRARRSGSGAVRIRRMTSSILATAMARPTCTWARVARLAEQMLGAPGDDLLAELDEGAQEILEIQESPAGRRSRPPYWRRSSLQRREALELVEHDIGDRVALELDDDAHAVAVALVAQSEMPSIFFSRTSSAMRSIRVALFT